MPSGLNLQPFINQGLAAALKRHRRWRLIDNRGHSREIPEGASPVNSALSRRYDNNEAVLPYDPNRVVDLPVDLSLLSDELRTVLDGMANGLSQHEVAEAIGYTEPHTPTTCGCRSLVQARMRTVRRTLCDGAISQKAAYEWLQNSRSVSTP
jgi:hypothetical protein